MRGVSLARLERCEVSFLCSGFLLLLLVGGSAITESRAVGTRFGVLLGRLKAENKRKLTCAEYPRGGWSRLSLNARLHHIPCFSVIWYSRLSTAGRGQGLGVPSDPPCPGSLTAPTHPDAHRQSNGHCVGLLVSYLYCCKHLHTVA